MLRHYLKIALRALRRRAGHTALNVFGLAVGIGCCLLIFLFVRSELAVNDVFPDADRIYRVDSDWQEQGRGLKITTLAAASPKMQQVYPEVASQTRLYAMSTDLRVGQTALRREVYVADSTALELFGLPLLHGDPRTALDEPRSVVLRADLARTLFGQTDVVGRTVEMQTWNNGPQDYIVTGVWEKLPRNSFTQFRGLQEKLILPQSSGDFVQDEGWTSWESPYIMHFVKLAPGTSVEALQAKLDGFITDYAPEDYHEALRLDLNPLQSLYLTDENNRGWRVIYLAAAVALLVLLIAGINFANLATAASLRRAREVGVRKTFGGRRTQLAGQFLGEALLVSAAATLLGAVGAVALLEPFLQMLGKEIVLTQSWDGVTLGALVAIWLLTGLAAGAYPALVLSGFDPADALKGSLIHSRSGGRLRRSLVVAQFAIAVVLLVGVYVVHQQVRYVLERDLGFQPENVMVIDTVPRDFSEKGRRQIETLKRELRSLPSVRSASLTWYSPGSRASQGDGGVAVRRPEWTDERSVNFLRSGVDDDFLETYGLALKRGRMLDDEHAADSGAVVVNEEAVRAMGLESPVGKELEVENFDSPVQIKGVVEDFHWQSLHAKRHPLLFFPIENSFWRELSVRLAEGASLSEATERIREVWGETVGNVPFQFTFMDDKVAQAYQAELRTRRLVGIGGLMAILLAVLGLFGLAALAARQRTQEIGIRKALGASAANIVALLSKDFAKLVLMAFVVATPVAWYAANRWLQDFAYRIELSPWIFLGAGAAALAIALATVSYHALRAARTNPADALRYE